MTADANRIPNEEGQAGDLKQGDDRMLPSFIVIGPGRSGTSWIYQALLEHPEVCTARHTKETLFFDQEYDRGLPWYTGFFEHCEGMKAVGEVSNTYIYDPHVPARIYEIIPNATLIACLRHPLERIRSVYQFRKRNGHISVSFEEAIHEQPDLVSDNRYWTQISRFREFFPDGQVKILFYDRLQADPRGFAQELYRTVGVADDFEPTVVDQTVNVSATPRIPGTGRLIKGVGRTLRTVGLYALLDGAKRQPRLQRLLFRPASRSSTQVMSPEIQEYLLELFEPEIEGIEQFTGMDLSHWKTVVDATSKT